MTKIRVLLPLAGCIVFAALIATELSGGEDAAPAPALRQPAPLAEAAAEPAPAAARAPVATLVSTMLVRPLFSPSRRPPETGEQVAQSLTGKRLAGIVIGPQQRLAIFAVDGAKSIALGEGQSVDGWQVDRITPADVSLRGPTGTQTLQPKMDPNLIVRQSEMASPPGMGRPPSPNVATPSRATPPPGLPTGGGR